MIMSAQILHGRRRGHIKDGSPSEGVNVGGSASAHAVLPSGTDLRQVKVLGKEDWNRIQYQLNKRAIESDKAERVQAERERLHELSKQKVKHWTNTIAGQRQRKLEARKLREEKEEEERKLVDVEEAKYEADKRKAAIDRAKTQQYYETDRVKGFHGALLLTEVLKERDAQVELKRLRATTGADKDKAWVELAEREHQEAILKDQNEARQRMAKVNSTAAYQRAQIQKHLAEREREAGEADVEKQELRELADKYQEEKGRLEHLKAAEARQLMADNLLQIADVRQMKEIQKMQDEEENEECRIFAAAKRKMMGLRAAKEKQLHNEKQETLEKIREKLHAQQRQAVDDEDGRIQRAVAEGEARRVEEEAARQAKTRAAHDAIAEHRYDQMMDKERKAAEERRKQLEMLMVCREADALFAKNEEEKRRRRYDESKSLQYHHEQQLGERQDRARRDREYQLEQDAGHLGLVDLEERQFQEYARRVIDHCHRGGRNTYPLRRAAREGAGGGLGPVFPGKGGVRPSYMAADQSGVQMPNYQRATTDETKLVISGEGQTNKRMGFVW